MTARNTTIDVTATPDSDADGAGDSAYDDPRTAVDAVHDHIARTALRDDPPPAAAPRIGLELEFHLVDLATPQRRPGWDEVQRLLAAAPDLPHGSRLTVEPGGQVELSTPPAHGVAAAIAALQTDRAGFGAVARELGYGLAPLGTDIARPAERVHPGSRYGAMAANFGALGCATSGRTMMCATAALQLNVDAGPRAGWADRVGRIRRLGPVLVALSSCSPALAGHRSGWHSMRQEAWYGIDARRGRVDDRGDLLTAWTDYALDAPLMLVRDGEDCTAVTRRVAFRDWLAGTAPVARRPRAQDVDYHLTTLFPPLRLRGFLELRCLDAVPDRWWPALAAITATLVDDPRAADRAAECCEPVADRWLPAARDGLGDGPIRAAALACVAAAAERCPAGLRADVEDYAALVERGRTPGDEVVGRLAAATPADVLAEYAR